MKKNRIEKLNLSTGTMNSLKRAGIDTIDKLTDKTPGDLRVIDRLGDVGIHEIEVALTEYSKDISLKTRYRAEIKSIEDCIDKLRDGDIVGLPHTATGQAIGHGNLADRFEERLNSLLYKIENNIDGILK